MASLSRKADTVQAEFFLKRFLSIVLLAWVLPPAVGMAFIAFVDIFSAAQMWAILVSWPMVVFIVATIVLAAWYFHRFATPIALFLEQGGAHHRAAALQRIRRFPHHFWGLFLLTLLLAPNLVMLIAIRLLELQPPAADWFRIHLVALIVSIVVGLPIFFQVIDLFGRTLRGVALAEPHITIRTKVFLIGSLAPLLIVTILMQYYWARTGYFTNETFAIWLLLALMAVTSSLLFMRSFRQSLAPLESLLLQGSDPWSMELGVLAAQSTDELGVLTSEYRRLLEHHRQVVARLSASEQELNNILSNMQDAFYRTDKAGRIIYITGMVEKSLGYTPEELIGMPLAELYLEPKRRAEFLQSLAASNGVVRNYEVPLRHKDGSIAWSSTNARFYRDENGEVAGVEGNTRDITQLKLAEQALAKEQQRALVTLESIGDGVMSTDINGNIDYLNPIAERLLDCELSAVQGVHYMEVLKLVDDVSGETLRDLVELVLHRDGARVHADDGVLTHRDGSRFTINITAAPMHLDNGEIIGVVLVLHDITEVMGMARQLSFQASHDMLTGLYNRREFEKQLEKAIRTARNEGRHHVLFYMDLDQFKVVNDTCGHRAGDELLAQLAGAFASTVREHDILARLGGDEFGVLLMDCPLDEAARIAENFRQLVRDFRFVWHQRLFDVGVSIGVVPITAGGGTLIDVLSTADAACYVAKEEGRNRVHVCHEDDRAVARHHREMEWTHLISSAFEENRFALFYQPILSLGTDSDERPYGEVLMRMLDEKGEAIAPMSFIPAAERYNLMPTIDRWVVRTTLGKLREAQGAEAKPPFRVTINLSGQSLTDEHFLDFVLGQFRDCDLDGESVCFEITETAAITNLSRARTFIAALREMGCRFALDDFGSGLSSFGYLKGLQVEYIKIDGAFVKDMVSDALDCAMVDSINQIGHVMGLKTIAEFAESEAIVAELRRLGVDYAQGYAIAREEPLDEVVRRCSGQDISPQRREGR
jgi:diguanylate cyclase (GGDEF)-like protein/PAS domain S-box-containing protein